jgi:hypothetical protein
MATRLAELMPSNKKKQRREWKQFMFLVPEVDVIILSTLG